MLDGEAAIDSLDHVGDGEGSHRHSGERFHLHSGEIGGTGCGTDPYPVRLQPQVHFCPVHTDAVRQGDEVWSVLGGLDTCDAGHGEDVPFGDRFVAQGSHDRLGAHHAAFRRRHAHRGCLCRDVDHVSRSVTTQVGEWV